MKKRFIFLLFFIITFSGCVDISEVSLNVTDNNLTETPYSIETTEEFVFSETSEEHSSTKTEESLQIDVTEDNSTQESENKDLEKMLPSPNESVPGAESLEEPNNDGNVTISFGGDLTLSDFFDNYIKLYGFDYPLKDVIPYLNKADISFFNLETSVGVGTTTRKPFGFGFISPPENLEVLKRAGLDLINAANNHIMDYERDVFKQTMQNLTDAGIKYTGIGNNLNEATGAVILERNGLKIGFMGFSSIIPFSDWTADENNSGVAPLSVDNLDFVSERINQANNLCDILIINVHWGDEYSYYPNDFQKSTARVMIDSGAEVIIGHHPHVLQGIEFYKDCPIFYSIGNFLFFKKDDSIGQTALFTIKLDKNGFLEGNFVPMYMSYCATRPVDGELYETIRDSVIYRSIGMGTEFSNDCGFWKK